jgi:hypothetical protein
MSSSQATFTLDFQSPQWNATVNLTAFASIEATMGILLDYNLNVFQNLTVTHLLQQEQCIMLPAIEFRILPESTLLLSNMGLNVSVAVNHLHILTIMTMSRFWRMLQILFCSLPP